MRHFLAAFALLLLLAACPGNEGSTCSLDEECAEDLTCFAETCQALGDPDGLITFEVLPPPGVGLHGATFPMARQPLRLGFCQPESIGGSVDGQAEVIVSGTPAGLPGVEQRWQQRIEGDFSLPLPAGAWQLAFLLPPGEDGLPPPPRRQQVQLGRCEQRQLGKIEAESGARQARFTVVIDPQRDPRARCGVVAQIHDPLTGQAISQAIAIEQQQGRPCNGPAELHTLAFQAPVGEEIELRLAPRGNAWPTLAQRSIRFVLPPGDPVDLGAVGVGAEAVLERLRVEVRDPDGGPVSGAIVRAHPFAGAGGQRFEAPAALELAEAPGRYELWLLPGRYSMQVEPPHSLQAASAFCLASAAGGPCEEVVEIDAGEPREGSVQLGEQLRLSGKLTAADGAALFGARIMAFPLAGGRRAETISFEGGRYELRLDPGRYELLVQPRDPDAAWRLMELGVPLVANEIRDLELPSAARVVGSVLATVEGNSVPLPRALVRAWRVDGIRGPRVVGESFTDAAGRFGLALPAEP